MRCHSLNSSEYRESTVGALGVLPIGGYGQLFHFGIWRSGLMLQIP